MFTPYIAADEATTLDAIHGNDKDAIDGGSGCERMRMLSYLLFPPLAATAEFAKTGKGLLTHPCANTHLHPSPFFPGWLADHPWVISGASKWASSGAPIHPSWPSSVQSSRASGTRTMPTRPTNLCFGWGYCQRECTDHHHRHHLATCVIDIQRTLFLGWPTIRLWSRVANISRWPI